jgi:hypothetical protein
MGWSVVEDTGKKQTTVRIDESLLRAVRVADATGPERLTLTDAIDAGIRLVLDQREGGRSIVPPSEFDGLSKTDRELSARIIEFLRSEHAHRDDFRKIARDMLNLFEKMSR